MEAEATPLPEARQWVVQRIDALRAENRIAELVDLLHERSALYEGRSEDETARIRGWILLSLGSGELPHSALEHVLEELESGRNPFAVAAAARALKAAPRLPEETGALIESAIRRMRYLDQPVDLDELSPRATGTTTATRELQAAAAEIKARRACCRQPPAPPETLPVTRVALGEVEVEDQDGVIMPLSRLFEGRVTALTFFYTRCGNPQKCSLSISKLARLRELAESAGWGDRIAVAAITYDPQFDLPPRLRAYGEARGLAFAENCRLLRTTGDFGDLRAMLDLGVSYGEATVNRHRVELALIGPDGILLEWHARRQWSEEEVLRKLRGYAEAQLP